MKIEKCSIRSCEFVLEGGQRCRKRSAVIITTDGQDHPLCFAHFAKFADDVRDIVIDLDPYRYCDGMEDFRD